MIRTKAWRDMSPSDITLAGAAVPREYVPRLAENVRRVREGLA